MTNFTKIEDVQTFLKTNTNLPKTFTFEDDTMTLNVTSSISLSYVDTDKEFVIVHDIHANTVSIKTLI